MYNLNKKHNEKNYITEPIKNEQEISFHQNKISCMKVYIGVIIAINLVSKFFAVMVINSSAFNVGMLLTSVPTLLIIVNFNLGRFHSKGRSHTNHGCLEERNRQNLNISMNHGDVHWWGRKYCYF